MRVMITGLGALTPIGNDIKEFREGLQEGRDGVGPVRSFDATRHRFQRAAELKGFDPSEHFSAEELPFLSRGTQMTRVAAAQALADAGLDLAAEDRRRVGVVLGTDLGGMPASGQGYQELHHPFREGRSNGNEPWRALLIDSFICSLADQLALHYSLSGMSMIVSTACSAGLHALGIGAEAIRRGESEVMIVGGVDPLAEMPQAGFGVLRSLASGDIRPFHRHRDGTMLGEAAAILVLESEDHARRRGARAWCELAGYGTSTDAYHMTRPDVTGEGPGRAMQAALDDARINADEIGYIKAHGTATPANDVIETRAIQRVFGQDTKIPVSSIKSSIGHSLGASGAVEALAAILALDGGFLPPTLHLDEPDPECPLEHIPFHGREESVNAVLSNAFGFGGNNASMVFRRVN